MHDSWVQQCSEGFLQLLVAPEAHHFLLHFSWVVLVKETSQQLQVSQMCARVHAGLVSSHLQTLNEVSSVNCRTSADLSWISHCLDQIYATQVPASNLHLPKYLKYQAIQEPLNLNIYDAINLFWCLINTDNIMIATAWEKNVSDQCFSMCCQWCKELFHRHLAGVS